MTRKLKPEMIESERRMSAAIEAVKLKQYISPEAAAPHFNVSAKTLRFRVNGRPSRQESRTTQQKVTPAAENELVQWITQLTITGYSPRHSVVREMAEELRLKYPPAEITNSNIGPLGMDWVRNFLRRHPQLKTVVGKSIEKSRVDGTLPEILQNWFNIYNTEVIEDENITMENVYNADESGFSIGTIDASRVIVNTSVGSQFQVNPGRQEWVTVMECICTDGTNISPMIIFKGESLSNHWIPQELPKNWMFAYNANGWTTNERGLNWLQDCFNPQTQEKAAGCSRVLICDGHGSHITGKFIRFCMDNNIKLLILPAHSSHFTQPLDIGMFSPLKKYMSAEVGRIIGTNISRLTKAEWTTAYMKARANAFTCYNIRASWDGAGLYPFSPRKVIRRVQPKTPSPPTSPTLNNNLFDKSLLSSSPSDMFSMFEANKELKALLNKDCSLNSPVKRYVNRLSKKAESWKARLAIVEKEKKDAQAVLGARKKVESKKRMFFKGKHLYTTEDIYQKVADAEKITEERRNKKQKTTVSQSTVSNEITKTNN
jgi:hypothetical protein